MALQRNVWKLLPGPRICGAMTSHEDPCALMADLLTVGVNYTL